MMHHTHVVKRSPSRRCRIPACWAVAILALMFAGIGFGCDREKEKSSSKARPAVQEPIPEPDVESAQDPITGEWRDQARFDMGSKGTPTYRTHEPPGDVDPALVQLVEASNPQLDWSPCLARAAKAYARYHPHEPDITPPRSFVEFSLHWAGCPDSAAAVRLFFTTEDGSQGLHKHLNRILPSAQGFSHVGIGRAPGDGDPYRWTWAVLLTERNFDLEDFPRRASPGARVELAFRLGEHLAEPEVLIMEAGGSGEDIVEATVEEGPNGHHRAVVPLSSNPGTQWVEILAEGPLGPEVVALFPVYVGIPLPDHWEGFLEPEEDWIQSPADAEKLMLSLVNRDRARYGLSSLKWDENLASVARKHSEDMRDHNFFAHVSPRRGTLSDRLRDAGYQARYSAENIARNPSIYDAQAGLMESLGHRANILSPDATHLGVGVAVATEDERRTFWVTQNFADPLERPTPDALRKHVRNVVTDARLKAGQAPIVPLIRLDGIADEAARVAAGSGFDGRKLNSRIGDALSRAGVRYSRFRLQYQQVLETEDFKLPEAVTHPDLMRMGVGVVEIPASEELPPSLGVLVLLIER